MTKNTKSALVASAVLGLVAGNSFVASALADHDHKKPPCTKANACSGKSECHTESSKCKGSNKCKGKGWVTVKAADKAACEKAGAHWEEPHAH